MIWAQTPDRVIGRDGTMPWHLPEDLQHFKDRTLGHPVVMGRRTWESFPERFRPLPGRTNIVVSRTLDADRAAGDAVRATGAVVVPDFGAGLRAAAEADGLDLVWVIGGATVYEQALDVATLAEVTVIDTAADGDTHAPALDARWSLTHADPAPEGWYTSADGLRYRFERWERPA
ncbi:dihydrofolate reductase [Micrococcus luteus]